MFFSSSPVNQPVPHLGNILKEIVDTVKEEMDEYKRDFSMTEEEKTDNDFKAFNSNKEEVYYPDNEFVYNLCSGLINLSEINDLRDNK